MSEAQEKLLDFASNGFKAEGFHDDMLAVVALLDLKKYIELYLK